MKPKYIVLVAVMAILVAVIASTYVDVSSTATFDQADAHPDREFHITGTLMKDMPIEYNPEVDANRFTFYLKDKEGEVRKVISNEPKLQDFERTEKVTMIGFSTGEDFKATKVLPKCPSKYKDQQDQAQAQSS